MTWISRAASRSALIRRFGKLRCEPAQMLLGFIIDPMLGEYLRRTVMIPGSDGWVFLQRPISAGLLAAAAPSLAVVLLPSIRSRCELAFKE